MFERLNKVPFYAHPFGLVVLAIISCAMAAASAVILDDYRMRANAILPDVADDASVGKMLAHPWLAICVGVVVGLICALCEKISLRGNIDFCADFITLHPGDRFRWMLSPANFLRQLFLFIPCVLAMPMGLGAAWILNVAVFPAVLSVWIPFVILYPDQQAIYERAEEIVEATYGDLS